MYWWESSGQTIVVELVSDFGFSSTSGGYEEDYDVLNVTFYFDYEYKLFRFTKECEKDVNVTFNT